MERIQFTDKDYWKAIVLLGLNTATYKIALGKTLLTLAEFGTNIVTWEDLSKAYLDEYIARLSGEMKPQLKDPTKRTVMERIILKMNGGMLTYDEAIDRVAEKGFSDVIPRFQTIGRDTNLAKEKFYEIDFGNKLILKDSMLSVVEESKEELLMELDSRWGLLEGAFTINRDQYYLANDIRQIYIVKGYERKNITNNIPFLNGYQANICFYCGEPMEEGDIHVDHVLPRQIVSHDEIWNLVLSHSTCNLNKGDHLVGKHYVEKLISRNENIMGSNHPWRQKIQADLGATAQQRKRALERHYDNVKRALGAYYWGGIEGYRPDLDPFYRSLITRLNN